MTCSLLLSFHRVLRSCKRPPIQVWVSSPGESNSTDGNVSLGRGLSVKGRGRQGDHESTRESHDELDTASSPMCGGRLGLDW